MNNGDISLYTHRYIIYYRVQCKIIMSSINKL